MYYYRSIVSIIVSYLQPFHLNFPIKALAQMKKARRNRHVKKYILTGIYN